MKRARPLSLLCGAALVSMSLLSAPVATAFERLQFDVRGDDSDVRKALQATSLVQAAKLDGITDPRDVLAAAGADYARLLGTLYAHGYYGGRIHILVDGREAGRISPLSAPASIREIAISVDPGPRFRFGRLDVSPLARGTGMPPGFVSGLPAYSLSVERGIGAGVAGWRALGHAKAAITAQSLIADHAASTLSVDVRLDPGPLVHFGTLRQSGTSAVRPERLRAIAGLPEGQVFSPEAVERSAARLRRTGVFRSVALTEADELSPGDTLDIDMTVVDEKPRRFGFGAEVSSYEGLLLSGYWMHRNLWGGAERLRVDGEVAGIGGQTNGVDYALGARLDRPATFGADTSLYALARIEGLDEPTFRSDQATLGLGVRRIYSTVKTVEIGVGLFYSEVSDSLGPRRFTQLTFPVTATWDRRDHSLNPKTGSYLNAELTPYLGLDGSASGGRILLDGRAYRTLGASERITLAGRLQFGSVLSSGLATTPPDYLFTSGGGGTVRGQPYQSLGVDIGGGNIIGGRSFVGASVEVRAAISGKWGVVAFADAGYIGSESLYDGSGAWHSGAGVGLRYDTGIGPVRFDVAVPTSGTTGDGAQLYVGIGQAF